MAKNEKSGLKSAFDLSMERLAQRGAAITVLSDQQKQMLADIARKTKASVAQIEILYGKKLAEANAAGDADGIAKIEDEMRSEIRKLKDKEETERKKIRGQ